MQEFAKIRKKTKQKLGLLIFLFLLPALLFYCTFTLGSLGMTMYYSFQRWNGIGRNMTFAGFENYARLFSDPIVLRSLKNNLLLVVSSVAFQIPPAMMLALLINSSIKQIRFFRTVFFLPQLLSTVAVGIVWRLFLDPYFGIINAFLGLFRVAPVGWLGVKDTAMWAVIAVIAWQNIPFHMILLNAGLVGVPAEIYESAYLDGASKWRTFWAITFPMISGTLKVSCTLALIGSLRYFDLIYVMTQGGPNNATQLLATYMYRKGFLDYNMGYASTIATALFVIIFVFTGAVRRTLDLWKGAE